MSAKRLLLVQCCHPPQLVFLAGRLRERNPGQAVDVILLDTSSNRARFEDLSHFDRVWFSSGRWPAEAPSAEHFEAVLFPFLGGGYRRLKKLRKAAGKKARACGWDAESRSFKFLEGWRSALRPPAHPPEFAAFMQDWPILSMRGRVLLVDTSPSLLRVTRQAWKPYLRKASQLKECRGGLLSQWRRLRHEEFQGAIVFFGAERGLRGLRALPLLLEVPRTIVVDEGGLHDIERTRHWVRFWLRRLLTSSSHSAPAGVVLFIQTEVPRYLIESVRRLRRRSEFRGSKIIVVCREDDCDEIVQALPDCELIPHSGRSLGDFWRLWKRARWVPAQVLCATFTGRPVFRPYKVLFSLLNIRRRLVFNASLGSYSLRLRTLPRLFRQDDLLFGLDEERRRPDQILVVQTDDIERIEQVLKRLRNPKIMAGQAPLTVVCNEELRGRFLALPQVDEVVTYRKGDWMGYFRLWRRLRKRPTDVGAALFSGRPTFRLPKVLFFLLRCRNRLIFNSHLECYYLGWRTWRYLLQRGGASADVMPHRLLLIQSEDDPEMLEALKTVQSPDVAKVSKLLLLCREDKRPFYQDQPSVDGVITYSKGNPLSNLGLWTQLREARLDSVAAVFSGRPIFRAQKLLFFLAPARHRLVINENQDCFYFRLRRLDRFLTMHGNRRNRHRPFRGALRFVLKTLLFFPRFFYLVIWLTYMRLRKAYSLRLEEAPERK